MMHPIVYHSYFKREKSHQGYGLQCGAEEDGSIIGSAEYVLGEGGVEDIMDWVGVISTYI